ncbi:MAG: hypothetical protein AAF598_17045 [Bacteroidota bacterium]
MSKQNNTLPIVLGVAVGVLLILNGYLLYSKFQQKGVIEKQNTELADAKTLQEELQLEYDDAIAQLDEVKVENEELYALIEEQKAELADAKSRIESAIRSGKGNKAELAEARRMIEDFKTKTDGYLAQIEELQAENAQLTEANVTLGEEKTVLQGIVEEQRVTTENLQASNADLEAENEVLDSKVKVASVLKAGFISVKALKMKDNGGEKEVKKAKVTDKIRVCLEVEQNAVTESGEEGFFLRIINPRGETLAKEVMGSGVFADPMSNESIRYTTAKNVDYESTPMDVCLDWDVDSETMEKGIYKAEIYNKGYLSGSKEFSLK